MTRHKSYKDMQEHLSERHKQILEILENKEMTTREIAQELYKKQFRRLCSAASFPKKYPPSQISLRRYMEDCGISGHNQDRIPR